MEIWKRNLYVVFFAETISITGMAFIIPFLPLYVKELGVNEVGQIARWSGLLISAPAIAMVIMSPVWGIIADRFGRKLMIERSFFGSAITIFLMSMVSNIYQLLFLLLLQGTLSGTIAACNSLISASSPAKKMGSSLGLLQTGVFLGTFLGPLLGGVSADIFGFQNSFKVTSALLFFSGWLVFFLVKEKFVPCPTEKNYIPFKKKLAFISNHKTLLVMFSLLFLFQLSIKAITPILSLFIETLVSNPNIVSSVTGLMFALTGMTAAISAVVMGNFFEKNSSVYILIVGFIGAGVFFFPQGLVTNIKQLAVLRFCLGLFYGAIIPIANTIISLSISARNRGKVFGISNSITFLGQIIGPIIGSLVMTVFNIPSVFFLTGTILLFTGLVLPIIFRSTEMSFLKQDKDTKEKSIQGALVYKYNE